MLKFIKSALNKIKPPSERHSKEDDEHRLKLAVTILLVEAMHADHELDEQEEILIVQIIKKQFALDELEARKLFSSANKRMEGAVSLHEYTSYIHSTLNYHDKQQLMINLWNVVLSDGHVDKYEEHLLRRISDLIHLSHKDFVKAKHQAQK